MKTFKEFMLERKLKKLNNEMFSLPNLVWDSKYHVNEEATFRVCPEYSELVEEYAVIANELNVLRRKRLGYANQCKCSN